MGDFIFVFGSNLAGRHGAGAAKWAKDHCGAVYGEGNGRTGKAYALPTKDEYLKTLPLEEIDFHVKIFLAYAVMRSDLKFLLTPIGTGLAGYSLKEIKNLFENKHVPSNVYLSREWLKNDE